MGLSKVMRARKIFEIKTPKFSDWQELRKDYINSYLFLSAQKT